MIDLNIVLKTVNNIRVNCLNLPVLSTLPKGRIDSAKHCPLANALGSSVFPDCMTFGFNEELEEKVSRYLGSSFIYEGIDLPKEFAEFVEQFDAGEIPELIEEEKEK